MRTIRNSVLMLMTLLLLVPSLSARKIRKHLQTRTLTSWRGLASWYGKTHQGRRTASGSIFNPRLFTAAHKWLPFGTMLHVCTTRGSKCVDVVVTDRGPAKREIDLSEAAAKQLGITRKGVAEVVIEKVNH